MKEASKGFQGGLKFPSRRVLISGHPSCFLSEVPLEAPLRRKRERLLEASLCEKREAPLLEASFEKEGSGGEKKGFVKRESCQSVS